MARKNEKQKMSISHLYKSNGPLVSSRGMTEQMKRDADIYYQHSEKAQCALVAMSSWYGGDVFEWGAHDLNTFRNLLTAMHLSGMAKNYPDMRFYAFDAFGNFPDMGEMADYFRPYSSQGDQIKRHEAYLDEHGLFRSQCHLVQGLFQDTCTKEWKDTWRNDNANAADNSAIALHLSPEHRNPKQRQIGFASIDCNIPSSYKTVFEFIFDMMAENSYVYMDEGLQSPEVMAQWKQFCVQLDIQRNMKAIYIRSAGGFGSLWRLYPHVESKLDL